MRVKMEKSQKNFIKEETSNEKFDKTNDMIYPDILRILAIISVVVLHSAGHMDTKSQFDSLNWWVGIVIKNLTTFGVPIFFMISGAFLLDKDKYDESLKSFFTKRFYKVGVPFIFWVTMLFFWKLILFKQPFLIGNYIETIVTRPSNPYWFFYSIMGLYLATPVIRIFVRYAPLNRVRYFIIVWFFFYSISFTIRYYTKVRLGIDSTIFHSYIGYFLLGFYLNSKEFPTGRPMKFVYMLVFFWISSIALSYWLNAIGSGADVYVYKKQSILQVIIQILIFLLVKSTCENYKTFFNKHKKRIRFLSSNVFGVYVVHIFILQILQRGLLGIKIDALWIHIFVGLPCLSGIVLLSSLMISWAMKKIPILKRVIP